MSNYMKKNIPLIIFDLITFNFSYLLALLIRYDFKYYAIEYYYFYRLAKVGLLYTLIAFLVFHLFKMYKPIWKFAGYYEIVTISLSSVTCGLLYVLLSFYLRQRLPISVYALGFVLQTALVTIVRFSPRMQFLLKSRKKIDENINRVMVIGAGEAGRIIVRELRSSHKGEKKLVCIIDDDQTKWGRTIDGIKVVGGKETIAENVKKYNVNEIMLTIPSLKPEAKEEIANICKEQGVVFKTLPSMYSILEEYKGA